MGSRYDMEVRGFYQKPDSIIRTRSLSIETFLRANMENHWVKQRDGIHRASLKNHNVTMLSNVEYVKLDEAGLHIRHGEVEKILEVDHVVVCAGQVMLDEYSDKLKAAGLSVHVIGGAKEARELDAKRAIREAAELCSTI